MKLWISRQTEVPIRDQIVTQITLAISSGDITDGEKLPSRGELSRRFGIHENTVSNAYKVLTETGRIEFRKGSGFYAKRMSRKEPAKDLESLTALYLQAASDLGAETFEIREVFLKYLERRPLNGIVVVEEDEALRDILIYEIQSLTVDPVNGISPNDLSGDISKNGKLVALYDEKRKIEKTISGCVYLKSRSIADAMASSERPEADVLIALVSGWDGFLKMASTILMAAQIDPDSIITKSTNQKGWKNGLGAATMLIADSLAAAHFDDDPRLRVFPFLSDESIAELRTMVEG